MGSPWCHDRGGDSGPRRLRCSGYLCHLAAARDIAGVRDTGCGTTDTHHRGADADRGLEPAAGRGNIGRRCCSGEGAGGGGGEPLPLLRAQRHAVLGVASRHLRPDHGVPGGRAPLAAELPRHHRRIHLRCHRRPATRRPPRARCQRLGLGDRQRRDGQGLHRGHARPLHAGLRRRLRRQTQPVPTSPTRPTAATARTTTYQQAPRPAAPCTTTCRAARCPPSAC